MLKSISTQPNHNIVTFEVSFLSSNLIDSCKFSLPSSRDREMPFIRIFLIFAHQMIAEKAKVAGVKHSTSLVRLHYCTNNARVLSLSFLLIDVYNRNKFNGNHSIFSMQPTKKNDAELRIHNFRSSMNPKDCLWIHTIRHMYPIIVTAFVSIYKNFVQWRFSILMLLSFNKGLSPFKTSKIGDDSCNFDYKNIPNCLVYK